MKKYELLEKAMRDYPFGTKYHWPGDTHPKVFTSSGVFYFDQERMITETINEDATVFNGSDWATIVKPEPLRIEKTAVRVNNEREFKFLMEHYEERGWRSRSGDKPSIDLYYEDEVIWGYEDGFGSSVHYHINNGYTVVDFDFFCAQKGLNPPKKIMVSEDGVDLYEGDKLFEVNRNLNGSWYITSGESGHGYRTVKKRADKWNLSASEGYESKAFSTKEAAEAWIKEQNRPKDIQLFDHRHTAVIRTNSISIYNNGKIECVLAHSDIEDIQHTILQQQSDKKS